jgi:hypothetical protein
MHVIPVNKVVDKKRIILKKGGEEETNLGSLPPSPHKNVGIAARKTSFYG